MGITRSFNKKNGIYYAYETTYEWDEKKQKKVQKKRCIGQFVPGTNEIIPNGARGKKPKFDTPIIRTRAENSQPNNANSLEEVAEIRAELEAFEASLAGLAIATHELVDKLASFASREKT